MTARRVLSMCGAERGSAVVEFALIAPMMLMTLLGLGDLAYQGYMHSVLVGAVEKAGRDSTIEGAGASTAAIDKLVMSYVNAINSSATQFKSSRKNYSDFSGIGAEPYEDSNQDQKYTLATDCFQDQNGNGKWDSETSGADVLGADGQGGADDVTVYTIQIRYPHIFPMPAFLNWDPSVNLTASTILKNQPYGSQGDRKVCPQ